MKTTQSVLAILIIAGLLFVGNATAMGRNWDQPYAQNYAQQYNNYYPMFQYSYWNNYYTNWYNWQNSWYQTNQYNGYGNQGWYY